MQPSLDGCVLPLACSNRFAPMPEFRFSSAELRMEKGPTCIEPSSGTQPFASGMNTD